MRKILKLIDTVRHLLASLNARVSTTGCWLAAALLFAMTFLVLMQIIFRYVLNDSLGWTEELSKSAMVWMTFLVAPYAYRQGLNVSIDLFQEALPTQVRCLMRLLLNLLVLCVLVVLFRESLDFVVRGMSIKSSSMPVQAGMFYTILPVSFAVMVLIAGELILQEVLSLFTPAGRTATQAEEQ